MVALSSTASADLQSEGGEVEVWGQSGDWTIFVDTPANGGCYMQRGFDNGSIIRLGLKTISHEGYFVVLNPNWVNIATGEVDDVFFDFGNEVFGGEAVGLVEGEYRGNIAQFNNPDLVTEIANGLTVVVSGSAGLGFEFTLRGTKLGIAETDRCRVAQRNR